MEPSALNRGTSVPFDLSFLDRISRRSYFLALFGIALVLLLSGISTGAVLSGDDSRVAGIAAEMAVSGDWIVPRLNGEPFLEYPPLFYWLTALCYRLFGIGDAASMVVPGVAGAGGALLLFAAALRLRFSPFAAFLAPVLLLTTAEYFSGSRFCRVDILLAFCFLLAMYGFLLLRTASGRGAKTGGWLLLTLGMAFGIMTKGSPGLALPGAALGAFVVLDDCFSRKFRPVRWLQLGSAGIAALIPVAVWGWLLVGREGAEALQEVVVGNSIGRFSGAQSDHAAPVYEYWVTFYEYFQPWLVPAVGGLVLEIFRYRKKREWFHLFLLSVFLAPYFLLSLASGKRNVYLLPLAAPAALLAADFAAWLLLEKIPVWNLPRLKRGLRILLLVLPYAMMAGGLVLAVLPGMPVGGRAAGLLALLTASGTAWGRGWRTPKNVFFLLLFSAVFLAGAADGCRVSLEHAEKDVEPLWRFIGRQQAAGIPCRVPRSERTQGAAVYYLRRTFPIIEKDAPLPEGEEFWVERFKRGAGGVAFGDGHRVYHFPADAASYLADRSEEQARRK